ncbi:HAUS3 protein, partial [Penelope pileata]|nr:HAUS3 protein [Penelope pileata]
SRGAEFVKTLQLFYPQADTFCEKDFDWLFDCPETAQFLEWFCKTVGEENVLSPAEVQAYDALVAAGKPILEGDALEQALQECQQVPQHTCVTQEAEGPSLEALQREVQELEDCHARQLWQLNKLQVLAISMKQKLRDLEEEEKVTKQALRKAHMDRGEEIFRANVALKQVMEAAKKLVEWYEEAGKGRPPALMHEMDLGPYMELEQQATDAFEQFIQQVLPGSAQAPDSKERSGSEELCVGDVEEKCGSQEATERMDTKQTAVQESLGTSREELLGNQGSFWMELTQMETAYICAQREVIAMSAKVECTCAALKWAEETLQALKENKHAVEAKLRSSTDTVKKQLRALRHSITQIQTQELLPQVKAAASLFLLPILQEQLSLENARLQDTARRQEEAAAWLVSQHSRLELLELQLKEERKDLDQKAAWLEGIETILKESQAKLQQYHDCFKEASSSMKGSAHTRMEPKDPLTMRLWDVLMGKDQDKQLSCSYEAIAAQSSQLVQEQKELEAQVAAPMPQLPALESAIDVLYRDLYDDSNQLQLSSPEIAEVTHQLITMQDTLHEKLTELLSDLKAKRSALQDPILQEERNLYAYFYCSEDRLREMVEELEKQALASSE